MEDPLTLLLTEAINGEINLVRFEVKCERLWEKLFEVNGMLFDVSTSVEFWCNGSNVQSST